MAHLELKKYSVEWKPVNYVVNEADTPIFAVDAGEFVVQLGYRILAAFGVNSIINVGDGDSAVGYAGIAAGTANTVPTFKLATGAFVINAMGKLYTATDTIDVDYTALAGAADGKMRFYIVKGRLEP